MAVVVGPARHAAVVARLDGEVVDGGGPAAEAPGDEDGRELIGVGASPPFPIALGPSAADALTLAVALPALKVLKERKLWAASAP